MSDLLTGGKIANELGISPAKVKKLIEELKIEPDQVKGACKYYGLKTIEKIKKTL